MHGKKHCRRFQAFEIEHLMAVSTLWQGGKDQCGDILAGIEPLSLKNGFEGPQALPSPHPAILRPTHPSLTEFPHLLSPKSILGGNPTTGKLLGKGYGITSTPMENS